MSKMKKTKIIKSILSLVITVGCLCACGSSDPAGTISKVTRQTIQEEERKLSSTAAKEKIFTKEVESVTIRYYIGYNIATGDAINDSIPCHQITVSGDDLETLVSLIGGLTKMAVDQNTDDYLFVESITDDYELTINDDVVLDGPTVNEHGNINRGWRLSTPFKESLYNIPYFHKKLKS